MGFYFLSQPIDNLSLGLFDKSMDEGTYSYFKTEYHHVLPYDIERELLRENASTDRFSNLVIKIKEKLFKSSFILVPINSEAHAYFDSEYRYNPVLKDLNDNIIIPDSTYPKKKVKK